MSPQLIPPAWNTPAAAPAKASELSLLETEGAKSEEVEVVIKDDRTALSSGAESPEKVSQRSVLR